MDKYFDFWDQFIQQWLQCSPENRSSQYFEWPSTILNKIDPKDLSCNYLPEPYWGWTGTGNLEIVVLNYNPGSGRPVQHIDRFSSSIDFKYKSFVKDQIDLYIQNQRRAPFKVTCNWHFRSRRDPLATYLAMKEYAIPVGYHNYLSIELIPWHTKGINSIIGYLENNRKAIKKYSLQFAIKACQEIANPYLRNKLIIRTSWDKFQDCLGIPEGFRLKSKQKEEPAERVVYNCVTLINDYNTEILIIWGNVSRNKLPPPEILLKLIR